MTVKVVDVNEAGGTRFGTSEPVNLSERHQAKNDAVLKNAPCLSDLYGVEQLEADRKRELVSLARLPGWLGCTNDAGHGWGDKLNEQLGGGICPGYMLAVGASAAGAGKTSFVMQVADGLALRTLDTIQEKPGTEGPLTPVVVLSEMSHSALTWRSVARWTGFDSRLYRAGASGARLSTGADMGEVWGKATEALQGRLHEARRYMRVLDANLSGCELLGLLGNVVDAWRDELSELARGRDVWPIVVIDPLQRWQDHAKNEVEALNELVEQLRKLADDKGLVVLATSDTNKVASTGEHRGGKRNEKSQQEEGSAVFRGSYKLQHVMDASLYLARPDDSGGDRRAIDAVLVKNRWGSSYGSLRYTWDVRNGRFEPPVKENKGVFEA